VNYRGEWHLGDGATFLGTERFVKRISKETIPPPISRRTSLKDLLKRVAANSGVPAEILLRKGRLAMSRRGIAHPRTCIGAGLPHLAGGEISCLSSDNVTRALQQS
jgi:hypothetical protein